MLSDSNRATTSDNLPPPLVVNGSINQQGLVLTRTSNRAPAREPPADRECSACNDNFSASDIFTAPCSHEHCRSCINTLVALSIQDESRFPPRCCGQPIPIEYGHVFSRQLVDQFQAKELEFGTPDRTYCNEPSCATFIPPTSILHNLARCPRCDRATCALCKTPWHEGVCPRETPSPTLLRLAEDFGWRRCHNCGQFIELEHGCYHMTCVCGTDFCYLCGSPWKTCDCNAWPAEERDGPLDYHECEHREWEGLPGPQLCAECLEVLMLYIFRCRGCQTLACRRCRFAWLQTL
ncbi:hypothetical protein DER45DRAFT_570724 [Fusarium avenaceum]|nr:hypothetical protein DER45DRAFT_570724 [Fusarium avenaceum]